MIQHMTHFHTKQYDLTNVTDFKDYKITLQIPSSFLQHMVGTKLGSGERCGDVLNMKDKINIKKKKRSVFLCCSVCVYLCSFPAPRTYRLMSAHTDPGSSSARAFLTKQSATLHRHLSIHAQDEGLNQQVKV
ncbi:hypothetical protein ILYODFUR_038680 [Ilyodon furcidens]|uniref:Uncharacterized protein n=1 Tax=Ilyodon furcidens TaxID=33524 RepID=A0ABV0V1K8_9TELE